MNSIQAYFATGLIIAGSALLCFEFGWKVGLGIGLINYAILFVMSRQNG